MAQPWLQGVAMRFSHSVSRMTLIMMAVTMAGPTYAFDGASFGAGLAGGLLGAAIAGAAQAQQPRYYYQRRTYVRQSRRLMQRSPRVLAGAPRGRSHLAIENVDVSTDQPWINRSYWNCNNPGLTRSITAHAEHGFVKDEVSSYMVCGRQSYPVKQFVYMSPSGFVGSDRIDYYDGRRLVAITNLTVRPGGAQWAVNTFLKTDNATETLVLSLSGCSAPKLDFRVNNGFAAIRHHHVDGDRCDGHGMTTTEVFYKAESGFVGEDRLTMYSSERSPLRFQIDVASSEPEVAAQEPKIHVVTPKQSSDETALADLASEITASADASVRSPPTLPQAHEPEIVPATLKSSTNTADVDGDVRGKCRMETCDFFKVQSSTKVGSTGNGYLWKVYFQTWASIYPDGDYDKAAKSTGDKSVEQAFFFCSKTRPTAFYRLDNQWFSRDLRPGDKSDVTNSNYNQYVEYFNICHHRNIEDPYNISDAAGLGYSFAPVGAETPGFDKKIVDPTDILK